MLELASLAELAVLIKRSTLLELELRVLLNGEGGASLRFGTWGLTNVLPVAEVFLGLGSGAGSPAVLRGKEKKKRRNHHRGVTGKRVDGTH